MHEFSGTKLTRTAFAQIPIALLEQAIAMNKKNWIVVYLWLWHYAGRDDAAWPSVGRLSLESRIEDREVRRALAWFCKEGWVTREQRRGKTSLFHVRMDRSVPQQEPKRVLPKRQTPSAETPVVTTPGVSTPGAATPGVMTPPLGLQPQGSEPPPNKKKEINNYLLVTSLSKKGESAERGNAALRAATTDGATAKKFFKPTAEDIPAELLPVQVELLEFWAEKAGSRSQGAWRMLLTELGKILTSVGGGTECVRSQLRAGTQAGWRGVTHRNWLAYGQPRQQPARRTRQEEAVDNVINFFKQHESQETQQWL